MRTFWIVFACTFGGIIAILVLFLIFCSIMISYLGLRIRYFKWHIYGRRRWYNRRLFFRFCDLYRTEEYGRSATLYTRLKRTPKRVRQATYAQMRDVRRHVEPYMLLMLVYRSNLSDRECAYLLESIGKFAHFSRGWPVDPEPDPDEPDEEDYYAS